MNRITNGKMKCKEKNRFKVALLIENPPQIHNTIVSLMQEIADKRLIITIAPQCDICPQGNTYPINDKPREMITYDEVLNIERERERERGREREREIVVPYCIRLRTMILSRMEI